MKMFINGRNYEIERIWSKEVSGKKVSMMESTYGYWFVFIGEKVYRCGGKEKAQTLYANVK